MINSQSAVNSMAQNVAKIIQFVNAVCESKGNVWESVKFNV